MKYEYKWQVLIIVCIGIFMSTLDGSILNIANPTIARKLNVNMGQIQWIVTSYMLVITSSLLFFGWLGDKIGSEKIYTRGFLVFTAGSFICSTSHTLSFLITARMLQAFGASMMMSTGIGIISNTFPPGERGKALGLTGSMVGIGNVAGPALGGLLVAHYSWNIIFLINVPIGIIGFFMAFKYLKVQPVIIEKSKYDVMGTILFALFAALLILTLVGSSSINFYTLITAFLALAAFGWYEKKILYPLIDFKLFKIHNFVQGNMMGMAAYSSQTFVFFLLPFFLERILKISPAYTGLLMAIPPVIMIMCAPLAGFVSDRLGSSLLTMASFSLQAIAYLLLSTLSETSSTAVIAAILAILGTGMAMFGSPNNSSILGSIPHEKAGYAGGFISTVRNLSYCLGTAVSVSIFTLLLKQHMHTLSYTQAYINAAHAVYWLGLGIACIGLLISLWRPKTSLNSSRNKTTDF
ncbi:MAG TPA: MFS transporter [Syntrophomonadaceae bacterium]|nr:MFS transporter [Syntrophomonadaceae bacterium]